jgi:hypothetical protein
LQRSWRKVEEGMVGFCQRQNRLPRPRDDGALFQPRDLSGRHRVAEGAPSGAPFFEQKQRKIDLVSPENCPKAKESLRVSIANQNSAAKRTTKLDHPEQRKQHNEANK